MVYEFEGKTEKDAIERAMQELGIERDSFDVEILEAQRGGLFKKGYVKIRLHTDDCSDGAQQVRGEEGQNAARRGQAKNRQPVREKSHELEAGVPTGAAESEAVPVNAELEVKVCEFVAEVVRNMGCSAEVYIQLRSKKKLVLNIESEESALIIGRKGKHIDAIQLLSNMYASKFENNIKIVLDCNNYRRNHEESLVRLARSVASKVRSSGRSILLEPMNPYDRRVIHTTIGDDGDIETESEGQGLYKQVRVSYCGKR